MVDYLKEFNGAWRLPNAHCSSLLQIVQKVC